MENFNLTKKTQAKYIFNNAVISLLILIPHHSNASPFAEFEAQREKQRQAEFKIQREKKEAETIKAINDYHEELKSPTPYSDDEVLTIIPLEIINSFIGYAHFGNRHKLMDKIIYTKNPEINKILIEYTNSILNTDKINPYKLVSWGERQFNKCGRRYNPYRYLAHESGPYLISPSITEINYRIEGIEGSVGSEAFNTLYDYLFAKSILDMKSVFPQFQEEAVSLQNKSSEKLASLNDFLSKGIIPIDVTTAPDCGEHQITEESIKESRKTMRQNIHWILSNEKFINEHLKIILTYIKSGQDKINTAIADKNKCLRSDLYRAHLLSNKIAENNSRIKNYQDAINKEKRIAATSGYEDSAKLYKYGSAIIQLTDSNESAFKEYKEKGGLAKSSKIILGIQSNPCN